MRFWRRRQPIVFCTIATASYLPEASVLVDSIQAIYGKDAPIYLLSIEEAAQSSCVPCEIITRAQIADPFHIDMWLRYRPFGLASAYKPMLLMHLARKCPGQTVLYMDADMEVFSPLVELEAAARRNAVVLTPHSLEPRGLDRPVGDRALLQAGPINSGIVAVDGADRSMIFLDWWAKLNRTECYIEPSVGYYSHDQKWLSLASSYFEGVHLLRHPGYNVAHFNLDERANVISGHQLRVFHYTMLRRYDWDIENYLTAFGLKDRDLVAPLLRQYAERVRQWRERLSIEEPGSPEKVQTQ